MLENLSDRYEHNEVEDKTYSWWKEKGYFKAKDQSTAPPFSIILPPPNVTGFLHMGHALDHTIQDVLIRWKRMSGFNAMWLPGTDHAGIATQAVVEKRLLQEEGVSRHDLGREEFVSKIWDWKENYQDRIHQQMEKLGNSVDWDRSTFTLDEGVSKAVRKVFVSLYEKGWIYKGEKLVNWSPPLQSAISDLEVVHKETKSQLWHIRYEVEGEEPLVIATTRPETLLGDTAICVHPEDERYLHLIGKTAKVPFVNRQIPIIADEYVDREFGSGALKVTPAHDFNDYELGKKHQLEMISILNKDGTLNENGGTFQGLKAQEARKQIVKQLEEMELLVKTEEIKNSVGYCDRTGAVAEPFLSQQWFVKTSELAKPAKHAVESGTIEFEPEMWVKTYLHWMNNIQDWCISRQLWWGHRIPVWNCSDCGNMTVSEEDVLACSHCGSSQLEQEEDVLDTWFSSALWPFSTMGWPEKTETLKTFYPTSVLVTGHDIIFFWVARMIMAGMEYLGDVPFRKVYIHGLIRDSQGRKMSKSLGNSMDPVDMIKEYGADSLRFTLMAQIASGKDIKFSTQRLEGYRNFMNKLWNATRFSIQNLEGYNVTEVTPSASQLSISDKWIIQRLKEVSEEVNTHLENYRFSDAANALYSFTWHEFCDWYLEFSKPVFYGEESQQKQTTQYVLVNVLDRVVRLLHPFIPFITETIYQKLPGHGEACIIDQYPNPNNDQSFFSLGDEAASEEMDLVKEVIMALRNIRGENSIKPSVKFEAWLSPQEDRSQKVLMKNASEIERIAGLEKLNVESRESLSKCALVPVRMGGAHIDVIVPLEGLVDLSEEIKRIEKSMEKVQKDVDLLSKKLGNERFVKNAPPEVVEKDKALLAELEKKQSSFQESLARLK